MEELPSEPCTMVVPIHCDWKKCMFRFVMEWVIDQQAHSDHRTYQLQWDLNVKYFESVLTEITSCLPRTNERMHNTNVILTTQWWWWVLFRFLNIRLCRQEKNKRWIICWSTNGDETWSLWIWMVELSFHQKRFIRWKRDVLNDFGSSFKRISMMC